MQTHRSQAYALVKKHRHYIEDVDPSWLLPLGVENVDDLDPVLASHRGSRSLMLSFLEHHTIPRAISANAPEGFDWLLRSRGFHNKLAFELGVLASTEFIRTTVMRDGIAKLCSVLGEQRYRQTLQASAASVSLCVQGLESEEFESCLYGNGIRPYFMRIGRSLLELHINGSDNTAVHRFRFSFPARDDGLSVPVLPIDRAQLSREISRLMDEL